MDEKEAKFSAARNALQAHLNVQAEAFALIEAEYEAEWKDLKEAKQELGNNLAANGMMVEGSGCAQNVVRLNIGGLTMRVSLPALMELKKSSTTRWNFGDLFQVGWGNRLPRDVDGRVVMDESGICVSHLLQTLGLSATILDDVIVNEVLPADEKRHSRYLSQALGLSSPSKCEIEPAYSLALPEESVLMTAVELRELAAALVGWCSNKIYGLELIYRGSRDGFTSDAFHSYCGQDSPSTVTLFRASYFTGRAGSCTTVIGGFSDVAWCAVPDVSRFFTSTEAFTFIAKKEYKTNLAKFPLREGQEQFAVTMGKNLGPTFGAGDLGVTFGDGNLDSAVLSIGSRFYDVVGNDEIFGAGTTGRKILNLEVYRVNTGASETPATRSAVIASRGSSNLFDKVVTRGLEEERTALDAAYAEQALAEARMTAALHALEVVYGPCIASGQIDEVIDISVRGTRITTLRSTLQACPPDSFLALWLGKDKHVEEHGRWLLDCNPAMFSKILDVLRVRKRAGWAAKGKGQKKGRGGAAPVRIVIAEDDQADFEELVNLYFPGCEEFITSLVQTC